MVIVRIYTVGNVVYKCYHRIMSALTGHLVGDIALGVLAIFLVGLTCFFARDAFRQSRSHRRKLLIRNRQREEFWGFE